MIDIYLYVKWLTTAITARCSMFAYQVYSLLLSVYEWCNPSLCSTTPLMDFNLLALHPRLINICIFGVKTKSHTEFNQARRWLYWYYWKKLLLNFTRCANWVLMLWFFLFPLDSIENVYQETLGQITWDKLIHNECLLVVYYLENCLNCFDRNRLSIENLILFFFFSWTSLNFN